MTLSSSSLRHGIVLDTPADPLRGLHSTTAPLLLWLALQLGVMLIAALRIPLAARYPTPAEQFAPYLLFSTQVVAAGLLFPFLMRDVRCTIEIVATAWPYQLAAGYLGGMAAGDVAWTATFVSVWLITLGIWANLLQAERLQMLGISLASCLTVGGGTLQYLRHEFPSLPHSVAGFEMALPLPATFALAVGFNAKPAWVVVIALSSLGAAALALRLKMAEASVAATPQ